MSKVQKKWKTKEELKVEMEQIGGIRFVFHDIIGYEGQALANINADFGKRLKKNPELPEPKLETIIRLFKEKQELENENKKLQNQMQALQEMLAQYLQNNTKN